MDEKTRRKLTRQIIALASRGLTPRQIYDRLYLVTFGSTTSGELMGLIESEMRLSSQLELQNRISSQLELQRYKLPANKDKYPIRDEKGNVIYESFEDELADRQLYLDRLKTLVGQYVKEGIYTQAEAATQLKDINNALSLKKNGAFLYGLPDIENAGLMPYQDTISVSDLEWRKTVREFEKTNITLATSKQRTRNEYMPFLNAQQASGQITPQEKQNRLAEIDEKLALGVSPSELPWAVELQNYQTQYESILKSIQQQNKATSGQQASYSNNIISPPEMEERWLDERSRRENEAAFEESKKSFLSQSDPYADWIGRWFVEHTENPFRKPDTRALDISLKYNQLLRDLPQASPEEAERMRVEMGLLVSEAESRAEQEAMAEPGPENRRLDEAIRSERTPPAPGFLYPFTGLAAGRDISKVPITTPSGQQWAQLLPTEKSMLGGFADWTGTSMADIAERMAQMRPRTPRTAWRWETARQR